MQSFLPSEAKLAIWSPLDDLPPKPEPLYIQSVLERIETTVEPATAERLAALRSAKRSLLDRLENSPDATHHRDYIQTIENCSESWAVWLKNGEPTVHPIRCKQRACPICQQARNNRWYYKLKSAVKLWTAPKHITLTVRSSDEPLDEQLSRLVAAFRRLRQRNLWKRRNPWGYWLIEITYNDKTGLWHPHLHVIANMSYLHRDALSEAWLDITGDSWVTGITAVKSDIASYLVKYISKTSSIYNSPVDPYLLNAVMKGKRMTQKFGQWPEFTEDILSDVVFVGTVRDIMRRARGGSPTALQLVEWLIKQHPHAVTSSARAYDYRQIRRTPVYQNVRPPGEW